MKAPPLAIVSVEKPCPTSWTIWQGTAPRRNLRARLASSSPSRRASLRRLANTLPDRIKALALQSSTMADAPLPDLILYGRPGCGLCDEAREHDPGAPRRALVGRVGRRRPWSSATSRPIPAWSARYFASIPVVELGDRRLELATSAAKLRRLLSDVLDAETDPAMTAGTDLTILVALAAGVDQLPVAVRAAARPRLPRPADAPSRSPRGAATAMPRPGPSRWLAVRHAFAFVAGFGGVFTLLGVTATYLGAGLVDYLPALRVDRWRRCSIVLGLSLAGILPHPAARSDLATARRGGGRRASRRDWLRSPSRRRMAAGAHRAWRSARRPARRVERAACWRRSGSGRSSRSAGRRASASSSAGSWRWPRRSGTVAQGTLLLVALLPRSRAAVHRHRARLRPSAAAACGRCSGTAGPSRSSAACSSRPSAWRWSSTGCALLPRYFHVPDGDLSGRPMTTERPELHARRNATASSGRSAGASCSSARSPSWCVVVVARCHHDPAREHRRRRPGSSTRCATPFLIDAEPPATGSRPARLAPELDGRPRRRHDLPADRPRRRADPARRRSAARSCGSTSSRRGARRASRRRRSCASSASTYRDRGLEVVGISVQETIARRRPGRTPTATSSGTRSASMAPGTSCATYKRVRPADAVLHRRRRRDPRRRRGPVDEARRKRPASSRCCRRLAERAPSRASAVRRSDRLVAESVAVAHEAPDRVRRLSCDSTMSQPSSAAWANSSALRATESSGKSSNAVTQRGFARPRPHEQVAEERQRPGVVAGAAHDDRLVAGRVAAGRDDRDARQELASRRRPSPARPSPDELELGLDVRRDEPRVVAQRDLPLGLLRDDRGVREGALAVARGAGRRHGRNGGGSSPRRRCVSGRKPAASSAGTIAGPS